MTDDDSTKLVIALDGPSGVGKSTVARLVAQALDVPYLDTGAMYRCVGLFALRSGRADAPTDAAVRALLDEIDLALEERDGRSVLIYEGEPIGNEIRTAEVARATSMLAAVPAVREWLVALQRDFAARHGGVLEGRDIGTVVVPETPFKFFLTADRSVRAERRWQEMDPATRPGVEEVEADIEERDRRDRNREVSPLRRTPEHVLVDTSHHDARAVAQRIVDYVRTTSP